MSYHGLTVLIWTALTRCSSSPVADAGARHCRLPMACKIWHYMCQYIKQEIFGAMSVLYIWGAALLAYALFYYWYIGFRKKITPAEVEATMAIFEQREHIWNQSQLDNLRSFLLEDDGRDFVMVNLLLFNAPVRTSRETMGNYQKVFMGELLRKGGHPVVVGRAASGSIDNVDNSEADLWHMAALVRYRSRRDLMEMIPATLGSEHHGMKLAALDKTMSFPASPWFMFGGPKVLMPLVLLLLALLGTSFLTG
jgi:hypothetical protein